MARFIHLNGTPGTGKSTIARAYAARHPGVLNLDIDQVVALIGGWQDDFSAAFEAGRPMAAAMARTHLAGGRDVIMPQLITNDRELADFEAAVSATQASYCHIHLVAAAEDCARRLEQRTADPAGPEAVIRGIVAQNGGVAFLDKIHGQLAGFLAGRPLLAVIDCEQLTPEQTLAAVEAALTSVTTCCPARAARPRA